MEDKQVNLIAASTIISLVILVVISRVILKLSRAFFLIAGADGAVIFAIFAWLLIRRRYNKRRKLLETQLVSEGRELRIEYSFLRKVAGVPTKFRYREIEEATDSFQALIGRGASASVFKGILTDGTSVAVKRIEGEERGEKEFRSEVAAIASVQHVNLVRLFGYCCVQGGPRFLVYEYIRNGSLDSWIFPKKEGENRNQQRRPGGCLSWGQRYRVALDVAKALCYLHHDCRSRILHLDVKPENILLDENYRAIVADFGLSRLLRKDESRCITTIRGTRGYLAPEWLLEQGISEKCDIYSYGMVLLEMIGGRRNACLMKDKPRKKWNYFPKIVNEKLREGKIVEVVDQRVIEGGDVDEREVKRMACVGLWCIQDRVRLRPSMTRVVEMLEGRVAVEEPPDTDMIVIDLLSVDEEETADDHPNRARVAPLMVEGANRETVQTSSINSFAMSDISPR